MCLAAIDGFNLSILECKLHRRSAVPLARLVLIYPYWNVNPAMLVSIDKTADVLIYPYWNVNESVRQDGTMRPWF